MLALAIYITGTTFVAVIEPDTISFQRIMYETADLQWRQLDSRRIRQHTCGREARLC